MSRIRVDFRQIQPVWLRYLIAIAVVAGVVGLAWRVGGDEPVPAWVSDYLVPALGWAAIVVFAAGITLIAIVRRQAGRKGDAGDDPGRPT